MDRINFTGVYYKVGQIRGYGMRIHDPEVVKMANNIEKTLDKAMGYEELDSDNNGTAEKTEEDLEF